MEKIIPIITREITLVCLRVGVWDSCKIFGFPFPNWLCQTSIPEQLWGMWNKSHRETSTFIYHFDWELFVFKHIERDTSTNICCTQKFAHDFVNLIEDARCRDSQKIFHSSSLKNSVNVAVIVF